MPIWSRALSWRTGKIGGSFLLSYCAAKVMNAYHVSGPCGEFRHVIWRVKNLVFGLGSRHSLRIFEVT